MASKQNAENPKETSKTSEKDTEPELQGKIHSGHTNSLAF